MMTILIILLALVFICGAPLFTVMLAGTALGTLFSMRGFEVNFDGAINKMFRISSRDEIEVLSTIPLFIFAGYILAEAKTADRLVRFANAMLGWMPGGLAVVTIGTCALFTVFTGASGVTIIALGGVLMPALVRNGYPKKFSMGLIAGTGAVGLLFPPALPLFIYGTVYGLTGLDKGSWATERFIFAGIVPGLVLIAMLSAVAITVAIARKLPRQKFVARELGESFIKALPELFIPFGVILGIATGFALPDIAALTVLYVLILEVLIFRTISFKQMWGLSAEAMAMIGAIFAIIFASTALTDFMVQAEVPKKLVAWTQDHVSSKIMFLLALNVILLIVGTVMDIFSAIVVVVPLVAPISRAYGIDPYHLGVIFLLNLEVGYLHPPVGLNLFLTSVKFQRPITEVMWATVPFLITMLVALFVISYVPALTVTSLDPTSFPEAPRTAPISNLVEIVQDGVVETQITITKVTLVDSAGVPLERDGKPIEKTFDACKTLLKEIQSTATTSDGTTAALDPMEARKPYVACRRLFIDVSACKGDKNCEHLATSKWTVDVLNDEDNNKDAVFVINELGYLDEFGSPITNDELDADGKIIKSTPIVDKDGKPYVRQRAWCDKLKLASDKEKCLGLFIAASSCRIHYEEDLEDVQECITEKCSPSEAGGDEEEPAPEEGSGSAAGSAAGSAGSGSAAPAAPAANPAECAKTAVEECVKEPVTKCIAKEVTGWVKANPSTAFNPPLK
jgi:tripartite ATP-independent transporter DctM subunit